MAITPMFWCIFVVVLYLPSTIRTNPTEVKCPVLDDHTWKERNSNCTEGKKYHCQDNEDGKMEASGCFHDKVCRKGAHPVIENGQVVCLDCPQGSYQQYDELISSRYTYSMCSPHGTCVSYEKTLCKPGTQEQDTTCQCSQSHRPSLEKCECFTNDDECYCLFKGCPNGTSVNEDGSCSPPPIPISSPSRNETLPEPGLGTVGIVVVSVITVIIIAFLAVSVICCYQRGSCRRGSCLKSNPEDQTDSLAVSGGPVPTDSHACNGGPVPTDSHACNGGPVPTENIDKRPHMYNIYKLKHLHISTGPEQIRHYVNLNHGGETTNQMNTDEDVSPDIESYNNSHGGESNGSINQMNTSEEVCLDIQGHQIPFPIPVTSAIDSLTETDAVSSDGTQSVSYGSQEGISGRPLHEDDTVPKMPYDRTQKSQETHVLEESSETDKLLHCERILG